MQTKVCKTKELKKGVPTPMHFDPGWRNEDGSEPGSDEFFVFDDGRPLRIVPYLFLGVGAMRIVYSFQPEYEFATLEEGKHFLRDEEVKRVEVSPEEISSIRLAEMPPFWRENAAATQIGGK